MRTMSKYLMVVLAFGFSVVNLAAQCPARPPIGSVVPDALNLSSTNGTLSADFVMKRALENGFTFYCYNYKTDAGNVESPTLRVNPGDQLLMNVTNKIVGGDTDRRDIRLMVNMNMPPASNAKVCGDTGTPTVSSTNVHFHGLNVPPKCHQDEVVTTLIQPESAGFQYKMTIPAAEPPGLYWYHPHVHGFTEFQVNGGAAGAIIVEGMEKVHPEVAGLTERVFTLRQQFLVPWIPGPYQLTINYELAAYPTFPSPVIQMQPNEKQFWRVVNATNQDFMPLEVDFNGVAQPLQLVALDGYPLDKLRTVTSVLLPPAGRAEFIVQGPPDATVDAIFQTKDYSTGPTGNPDLQQILGQIHVTTDTAGTKVTKMPVVTKPESMADLKFAGLKNRTPTATRELYFSEEFGGTGGPIQFYITVKGQKQRVFEPDEKPVITTHVGAVEDWTIENHALETHAFHIHQIHFMVLEIDGKPVPTQDLRDTIEVPFWEGPGHPYHSVKLRMDFTDPNTAGMSLFHCHILLHEDLGMMHKIQVLP